MFRFILFFALIKTASCCTNININIQLNIPQTNDIQEETINIKNMNSLTSHILQNTTQNISYSPSPSSFKITTPSPSSSSSFEINKAPSPIEILAPSPIEILAPSPIEVQAPSPSGN